MFPESLDDAEEAEAIVLARLSRAQLLAGLMMLSMIVATLLWFLAYRFRTLMGDDIYLLDGSNTKDGYASRFLQSFMQQKSDKYRPVLAPILSVVLDVFGGNHFLYQLLNVALLALVGGLAALMAYRLSRGSYLVAILVGVAVVVSRFNLYYVLQVFGLMESIALAFVLVGVLAAERVFALSSRKYLYVALLAFFLSIYTHERYIGLVLFFFLVALWAPIQRSRQEKVIHCLVPLAVLFSNYAIKAWVLHTHFLTGGGSEDIRPKASEVAWFSWRALLNVLGYNSGPDYLSGRNAHSLGSTPVLLALLFAVPALALLGVAAARERQRLGWGPTIKRGLLAGSLLGPVFLSTAITFRQEYRWLMGPYVVAMLVLAWVIGALRCGRSARSLVVGWFIVTTLGIGLYYRQYADGTYFFAGQRAADSVFDRVVSQHREKLGTSTIFIVTHGDTLLNNWYLGNGAFFRAYAPGIPMDVRFVDEVAQAVPGADTRPEIIVFDYRNGDRVVQIGDH